jgi:hypothetical protein
MKFPFSFWKTTKPVISALSYPLMAPELGGGTTVLLYGVNLTAVTAVHVGGQTVAPTGTSFDVIGFVWPANTASITPYNISVTSPQGTSNVLANAVYYVPSCFTNLWWAGEGVGLAEDPITPGVWEDCLNTNTLPHASHSILPTYVPNWHAGNPAWSFDGTGAAIFQGLVLNGIPQPASIFVVGDSNALGVQQNLFDSDDDPTNRWIGTVGYPATDELLIDAEGAFFNSTDVFSTPCLVEFGFNGASSYITKNNTSTTTGTVNPGPFVGMTVGAEESTAGNYLNGHIALIAVTNPLPTAPQQVIFAGIMHALGIF